MVLLQKNSQQSNDIHGPNDDTGALWASEACTIDAASKADAAAKQNFNAAYIGYNYNSDTSG